MDGADHYRMAMDLLAVTADPSAEEAPRVTEFLLAANVHMTAALLHAQSPEQAREWSTP